MATLPVLPLADAVLLPGMVIPVTLEAGTQAAVDAARAAGDNTLVAVPRLDGAYGPVGTVAVIEKVGRLPSGEPSSTSGRGALLTDAPCRSTRGDATGAWPARMPSDRERSGVTACRTDGAMPAVSTSTAANVM